MKYIEGGQKTIWPLKECVGSCEGWRAKSSVAYYINFFSLFKKTKPSGVQYIVILGLNLAHYDERYEYDNIDHIKKGALPL